MITRSLPGSVQLERGVGELRLEVVASGQPPIAFKWYCNGVEVTTGQLFVIVSEGGRSSCLLKQQPTHQLKMTVDVFNQGGVARSECVLLPAPPPPTPEQPGAPTSQPAGPKFAKGLQAMEVNEGETLTAGVGVEKDAEPCVFKWRLGKRVLNSSQKDVVVDSTGHESLLTLSNVVSEMAGVVEVTAKNRDGEATSAGELKISESELLFCFFWL